MTSVQHLHPAEAITEGVDPVLVTAVGNRRPAFVGMLATREKILQNVAELGHQRTGTPKIIISATSSSAATISRIFRVHSIILGGE